MRSREKWSVAALCLVLIAWGLQLFHVWPVLVAHLSPSNWIMIALIQPAALLALIGVYARVPKDTAVRWEVVLATVLVIMSWSMNLSLVGKIGGR